MTARAFGALLLDLYRYSRELTLAEFPERALARLQSDLPFDSAWWGVARRDHKIHSSFPYRLPADYAEFYWDHVSATDTLAEACLMAPGRAARFGPGQFADSPGLTALTRAFGIRQAICNVTVTPTLNLVMFAVIYRHQTLPAFTEAEREYCEILAPHLWATWTANWIAQMEHVRAHSAENRLAHAIADQRGILHSAEPRFVDLLRDEWPAWNGPVLPLALRQGLQQQGKYRGRAVALHIFQASGMTLLEARVHSPLDGLSPRERTIAAAFGEGHSYKRIAADLGLSPATIRHHLRRIYTKTNISNKTQLTHMLSAADTRVSASIREQRPSAAPDLAAVASR